MRVAIVDSVIGSNNVADACIEIGEQVLTTRKRLLRNASRLLFHFVHFRNMAPLVVRSFSIVYHFPHFIEITSTSTKLNPFPSARERLCKVKLMNINHRSCINNSFTFWSIWLCKSRGLLSCEIIIGYGICIYICDFILFLEARETGYIWRWTEMCIGLGTFYFRNTLAAWHFTVFSGIREYLMRTIPSFRIFSLNLVISYDRGCLINHLEQYFWNIKSIILFSSCAR